MKIPNNTVSVLMDTVSGLQEQITKIEKELEVIKNTIKSEENTEIETHLLDKNQEYTPTCPRGYNDCIHDPAYIKHYYPDWYKDIYGDITPEQAAEKCKEAVIVDPNEDHYCYDYDSEDK